jgi:hypothetical protein
MEPIDAAAEVARLKALCPGVNQEQEDFWFEQFQRFPLEAVRAAVGELAESVGDFVDRPRLLALIWQKASGFTAAERIKAARLEAAAAAECREAEAEAAAESQEAVDRYIGDSDDAHLANLVSDAMSSLSPEAREFLSRFNPRKNPFIRAVVYETRGR